MRTANLGVGDCDCYRGKKKSNRRLRTKGYKDGPDSMTAISAQFVRFVGLNFVS